MNFNLKKPCENCPFRKEGAIELRPGRVESIVDELLSNDKDWFKCHKTLELEKNKKDSQCVGAMIYLLKAERPSVSMRMAAAFNLLDYQPLIDQSDIIIDVLPRKK